MILIFQAAIVLPPDCEHQHLGDGKCDDGNNREECGYDNGDCCPPHRSGWNQTCSECECRAPPTKGCGLLDFVGNSYCDDENNNAECNFDNGDCCPPHGLDNWDQHCTACECKERDGDGKCDDEKSQKWCNKNKKKCSEEKIYKKCMKTCERC